MLNQQIHNYKIISLLGEGGMANVYLAQHQSLGNNVAVKLLKDEFVQHPNIRKRFLSEARSLAKMNHPNVIKVTDLIDAGDIVAFVMEYIEGQTLEDFLSNSGKLSNTEIENMFSQMILAVEYVHSQGLIHRDIKPSNFMVTPDGAIKLLDFGIAKNLNDGAVDYTKTSMAQQMGTPLYMSPEQVRNTSEITPQTDIYSLGVVLWQMVMNKKPYDASKLTLPEIQVAIMKDPLPLTNTGWDEVIESTTSKDIHSRSDFDEIRELASYAEFTDFFSKSEQNDNLINIEAVKDPDARFQTCEQFKQALLKKEQQTSAFNGNNHFQQNSKPNSQNKSIKSTTSSGVATASLVLGIIGFIFCWFPFLNLILGILSFVFGIKGQKDSDGNKMSNAGSAVAGIVLGSITLFVTLIQLLFLFARF